MRIVTTRARALALLAASVLWLACGGESSTTGAGAGDAALADAEPADAEPADSTPADVGVADVGGVMPTACAGLRDEFSGATLDSATWRTIGFMGWTPQLVGGRLTFTPTSGYTGTRTGLVQSRAPFDLTGCSTWVEVARALPTDVTGEVNVSLSVASALMRARQGRLQLSMVVGGTPKESSIPYDPVAHRWFRFREAAGVLYMETSPDARTWTERFQGVHGTTVTAVLLGLNVITTGSAAFEAPQFDNVNAVP